MRVEGDAAPSPAQRRGDEGASAVEFALVLPFLLMLVFGMLTGGITLNQKLGVEQANREAARWGATLPLENFALDGDKPGDEWFAEIAKNAVLSANGELDEDVDERFICVGYIHDEDPTDADPGHAKSVTWDDVGDPITATNFTSKSTQCFGDGLDVGTPHVQVEVSRPGWLNIIFLSWSFDMQSRSVAIFEPAVPY